MIKTDNVISRLRTPKGFSSRANRKRSKDDIANDLDRSEEKLEAAARRIIKQAELIEKLTEENLRLREASK